MSNIGIISDDSSFAERIEKSIILLRKDDNIVKYDFSDFKTLRSDIQIVLLYTENTDKISDDFIKRIKNESNYIILFIPDIKDKLILELYDRGINDFCSPEISMYSLLVKIINAQKHLTEISVKDCYKNILISKNILKENNSVCKDYTAIFCPKMKNLIEKSSLLAIDIPLKYSEKFITDNLENRMVSALRYEDMIINYREFSYLIVLKDAEFEKVRDVFDKLSNVLGIKLLGMQIRYKSLNENEIMEKIDNLRVQAQKEDTNFVVEREQTSTETEKDWLDDSLDIDEPQNYKFFQAIYNSKVEKIIKPVFFRMKEKYENLDKGIKIDLYSGKNFSEFYAKKNNNNNSIKILFENTPALRFELNYSGIYTPENKDFTLPFAQLTLKKLNEIVEKFINEGLKDETVRQK